ncbi:HTTM domain-containing protein [Halorussus halobius]|uniref:HTTM domain-containing protein n=1 Tax=Halorussus halobius TaxID=1710537 RepID=UPI00109221E8|nr:HTTM domain-containing protein [Halorussus halobius]
MSLVPTVIALVALGTGVHAIYTGVELLSLRRQYDDGGLFSWEVRSLDLNATRWSRALRPLFGAFPIVLVGRILVGSALVALGAFDLTGSVPDVALPAVVLLALLNDVLVKVRHSIGLSGAFDMSVVTNFGLLIATVFPDGSTEQLAAVLFIAVQGILGYFLAGVAKVAGRQWRNGDAIEMVVSTKTWGDDRLYRFVAAYPSTKRLFSWSVIGFEVLFPVVLFLDPSALLAVFVAAFAFHFANGAVVGINSFMLMFPATYPAIYYANQLVPWSVT